MDQRALSYTNIYYLFYMANSCIVYRVRVCSPVWVTIRRNAALVLLFVQHIDKMQESKL